MDLSSILPMLLNKNGDGGQMQNILQAVNGGGGAANNASAAPADPMQTMLAAMASGKKPDLASLMSMATMKKTNVSVPVGFKAIANIAPNDILGCLMKIYIK